MLTNGWKTPILFIIKHLLTLLHQKNANRSYDWDSWIRDRQTYFTILSPSETSLVAGLAIV